MSNKFFQKQKFMEAGLYTIVSDDRHYKANKISIDSARTTTCAARVDQTTLPRTNHKQSQSNV